MKKSLVFMPYLLICSLAFAFDAKTYNPLTNVNTCVKNEYSVTSKFGSYYRTLATKTVNAYDASGLLLEEAVYTAKDKLTEKTSYTYDTERNLTEKNTCDAEGNSVEKFAYTYSEGKLKEIDCYKTGNFYSKTIFKTENGKTDKSEYNEEGALVKKTFLVYQGSQLIEENVYSSNGQLDYKKTYAYNDKNKIDSIVKTNPDGEIVEKTVFRYDAKGNLSEETYYEGDAVSKRVIFKCTEDGNIAKVSYYDVCQKFGATANELTLIYEFSFK